MVGRYTFVGYCVAALSAVAYGQDDDISELHTLWGRPDTPFTFTDCAAPTEMETCWNAEDPDVYDFDEECVAMQNRIGCVLTNCWNRVYSCNYQELMVSYNTSCSPGAFEVVWEGKPALTLPFFPAPAGAAESCSCDLNRLNDNMPDDHGYVACQEKVRKELGENAYVEDIPSPDCDCCEYGAYAASIRDTCKDQDPGYIVLDYLKAKYFDKEGSNNSLAQCASRLQNFNCVDNGFTYGYGVNASDYAKPTPLHSATGTWSDINGILTAPVSGATYTWTGWNATFTVTAASVEAVATRSASTTRQTTSSATGKDAGSMTGSATDKSGTASGASSTSAGAAPTLMAAQYPAAALMGLSGLAFALL